MLLRRYFIGHFVVDVCPLGITGKRMKPAYRLLKNVRGKKALNPISSL
jgi:hypothetical protein